MKRSLLLTLATLTFAATTMIRAQDEKDDSFTVKCVYSGLGTESSIGRIEIENETLVIKEAVATDISIRRTVKQEDGGILSWTGRGTWVPSPALMAKVDPDAVTETIRLGPQLTCRIQRVSNGILLLDATLADTVSKQHDLRGGTLIAVTRQLRSIQPVRTGQAVTLSWPAIEKEERPRQVTITILDTK